MPIITTGKKLRKRSKNDYYPTAPAVAEAGIRQMLSVGFKPKTALDPGAGDGIFGDAVKAVFPECVVDGIDIRPGLPHPASYRNWWCSDFLMPNETDKMQYDLIVGNPPYGKLGEAFIRKSMRLLNPDGVCLFLFRATFVGSQDRILGVFQEHPMTTFGVICPRPSFLGKDAKGKQLRGTDADEYAYFRFDNPPSSFRTVLDYVYWGKKNRKPDTRQLSFL